MTYLYSNISPGVSNLVVLAYVRDKGERETFASLEDLLILGSLSLSSVMTVYSLPSMSPFQK